MPRDGLPRHPHSLAELTERLPASGSQAIQQQAAFPGSQGLEHPVDLRGVEVGAQRVLSHEADIRQQLCCMSSKRRDSLSIHLTTYTVFNTVVVVQCMGYSMTLTENLFENLRLELRRGCLTLAVLAQLHQEYYGYTLRKALAERGLDIDESTLYPLLRRLEAQGLLESQWREEEKRNKRFYRLSADGQQIFEQLLKEWQEINASIHSML